MDRTRIHHQLAPMVVVHEKSLEQKYLDELSDIGHVLEAQRDFAAVTAISRNMKTREIFAAVDHRRGGSVSLF